MFTKIHPFFVRSILTASFSLLTTYATYAHVTYTGRDFGTFTGDGSDAPATISIGNVSSNFGWADATDGDFGDSHRTRAFRFTLTHAATVTLQVQGAMVGAAPALPYPAFSIYSGLCHIAPDAADHDATEISITYLNSLGGVQPKEGALVALGNWKIGNDDVYNIPDDPTSGVAAPASLSSLTYMGHAADGTPINYGSAPGIHGDGLPDGNVSGTFVLPAGDYTVIIGGADYNASISAAAPYSNYGISATLSVTPAPEPIAKGEPCSAIAGSNYSSVYRPAINGSGTLAVRAGIKSGRSLSNIIARRTTATEVVARTGMPAADTTSNWKSFGDPILNDAGEVAFNGALVQGTGSVTAADDTGVWSDLGGTLHLVLREGSVAPGTSEGQKFTKASWFNLQQGALYLGAATSNGSAKSSGVWKWNGSELNKVVAMGDSIELSDGNSHVVRMIATPASTGNGNATSRIAGSDGSLALLISCSDGRVEVVTFR